MKKEEFIDQLSASSTQLSAMGFQYFLFFQLSANGTQLSAKNMQLPADG